MTETKAKEVISDAITAGYSVRAHKEDTIWIVEAYGPEISVTDVSNFAIAKGVNAFLTQVKLI